MRSCFGQVTVVFFEDDIAVLEDQQSVDVLAICNLVDGLLVSVEVSREVSHKTVASFKRQDTITIVLNIDCRQYLANVAEAPAILGTKLKIGKCN